MRIVLATLAVLAIPPVVSGIDGVPKGPDLDDLSTRVTGSVYVVKGRVLERRGAGGHTAPVFGLTDENRIKELLKTATAKFGEERAMEIIRNAARPEPLNEKETEEIVRKGGAVLMDTDPGGSLYTVAVDQVLCRQSDFSATPSLAASPVDTLYMFVPFQERTVRSMLDRGRFVEPEALLPQREYLLFLRAGPPGAALAERYGLDPGLTYYRAYEGSRGAVPLPDAAHPEEPYTFVTALVSAVTTFCGAVQAPDVATKILNLNAVKDDSTDRAWRQNVDAAIRALQQPQPKPLQ